MIKKIQKKYIIGLIALITIIIFVNIFLPINNKENANAVNNIDAAEHSYQTVYSKGDRVARQVSDEDIERYREMVGKQMKGMSKEDAFKKYTRSRNITLADPALSQEAKEYSLNQLDDMFMELYGEVPEETQTDRKEQARMKKVILEYKEGVEKIKSNKSLSRREKADMVHVVLEKYLSDMKN
ncbi:MAG: hypothetical protein GY754_23815 [bacterium]|nr:hypothetical protein [bacterium]